MTYQLRSFALFRFIVNWIALLLIVVGVLNWVIFGFPPTLDSFARILFSVAMPIVLFLAVRYNWPMVWKIETTDDGLLFCTLFQKRFVRWNSLTDVVYRHLGEETLFTVHYRNGDSIQFPSGMNRQDELLASIRQYVPERLLTVEKESRQGKISLFQQGFFLIWSVAAIAGGIFLLISLLRQLLSGELINALWIAHPALFLVIGIILGVTTVIRAKSVRITVRGVLVRTWHSELDITWQDVSYIRQLPFGRSIAVKSRLGWFILGAELSRFDELRQLVGEHPKLIDSTEKRDNLLG